MEADSVGVVMPRILLVITIITKGNNSLFMLTSKRVRFLSLATKSLHSHKIKPNNTRLNKLNEYVSK